MKLKAYKLGKEEVKLFLFTNDMILCIENLKTVERLLGLINKLSKVAEYKINIQKSVGVLYINNEFAEK